MWVRCCLHEKAGRRLAPITVPRSAAGVGGTSKWGSVSLPLLPSRQWRLAPWPFSGPCSPLVPRAARRGCRSALMGAVRAPNWAHTLERILSEAPLQELAQAEEALRWLLRRARDLMATRRQQRALAGPQPRHAPVHCNRSYGRSRSRTQHGGPPHSNPLWSIELVRRDVPSLQLRPARRRRTSPDRPGALPCACPPATAASTHRRDVVDHASASSAAAPRHLHAGSSRRPARRLSIHDSRDGPNTGHTFRPRAGSSGHGDRRQPCERSAPAGVVLPTPRGTMRDEFAISRRAGRDGQRRHGSARRKDHAAFEPARPEEPPTGMIGTWKVPC